MAKNMRRTMALILALIMACIVFTSCVDITVTPVPAEESAAPEEEARDNTAEDEEIIPMIENIAIQHEPEFGGVYIEMTIEDFNEKGFEYGDSVDVIFSNGYALEDIPYYNGYYVDAGDPLLIAYPGYDYIKAAVNYGEDLWETAELKLGEDAEPVVTLFQSLDLEEHDTATVVLRERGKYKDIQIARDIHYKDERNLFPSDEVFANFRNMTVGDLREGAVYRSASPCDNQHNRAPYVDALIADAGVNCILDLADNDVKINRYMAADDFNSPYFQSLYDDGKVIPLAMNMNFFSDEFKEKLAYGLTAMSEADGPYLIHCTEGKDRTGFVCMLVEMLAGASYQEIVDDYMVTYDNYYEITEEKDKQKYDIILDKNLIAMMKTVVGDDEADLTTADLAAYSRQYLIDCGMEETAIDTLLEKIR